MLTYKQNVKAILECIFAGYKDELIEDACESICALKCSEKQEDKTKLTKAKEIIKEYYKKADCGIFRTRNTAGDTMYTLYDEDGLTIDICYNYAYFEVFGLDAKDYKELRDYYINLIYRKE